MNDKCQWIQLSPALREEMLPQTLKTTSVFLILCKNTRNEHQLVHIAHSFCALFELGLISNGENWLGASSWYLITKVMHKQTGHNICSVYCTLRYFKQMQLQPLYQCSTSAGCSEVVWRNGPASHKGWRGCYSSWWFNLAYSYSYWFPEKPCLQWFLPDIFGFLWTDYSTHPALQDLQKRKEKVHSSYWNCSFPACKYLTGLAYLLYTYAKVAFLTSDLWNSLIQN